MEPFVLNHSETAPSVLLIERWNLAYPKLRAGFSTRSGGVSTGYFDSLNCALHVNDKTEDVIANRSRLARATGFQLADWTCAEQIHSNHVTVVTSADRGSGLNSRETALPDTDALMTNEEGIWLNAFFADCVPLYFFDPINQALALAHAGWRGTVSLIAEQTVEKMVRTYGSRPEQIVAAIGPSIGRCCYEVDNKVIDQVDPVLAHIGQGNYCYTWKDNGRAMLDLKEMNRQIMIKAGILPIHIEISQLCTSCHHELFFSHRKEQGRTGRMTAWIGRIKE